MESDMGFSNTFMLTDEEMEEFRLEKSVTTAKSPEELQKLMVDENLNPIERACLLISTGQDVQRVCTIEHLPELLESAEYKADTLSKVFPKLCTLLSGAMTSPQILISASKVYALVVGHGLVDNDFIVKAILPTVLTQIDNKDPIVASSWEETLLSSVPCLTKDIVEKLIVPVAILKGQLSQPVASRMTSCKLMGRMANSFEPHWLEKELLPLATTLCQDVSQDVRTCMCYQLEPLARALSPEVTKTHILHEISELLGDEEWCVRGAAVETLVGVVPLLDRDTLQVKVVPLLMKACDHTLTQADSSLPIVAKQLGRMCHELKESLSPDQHTWFIDYYCKLSSYSFCDSMRSGSSSASSLTTADNKQELECRRMCAYNFPAMLLFAGQERFKTHLLNTFQLLVEDGASSVRRCVACGFHEIASIMGDDCTVLFPFYQTLLRDSSFEVLSGLAPHLSQVMESFAAASDLAPDTRHPGLLELVPSLIVCEQTASSFRQWRLHEEFLNGFSSLTKCMTSEQLHTKFMPIMFKYITRSCVLPVKMAAGRTCCVFIRNIRKADQRKELCARLVEECCKSTSYRQRLFFVDICQFFLDTFSRSFFKEHFFVHLLTLSEDKVVNIRLRLYRILPSLKAILKLPGDRLLLQQLEQVIRKLISQERDTDASQAIRDAVAQLDRIEIAMETLSRRTFFEADMIDQARVDEETQLVELEEKQKELLTRPQNLSLKASPSITRAQLDKKATKSTSKPVPSPTTSRKNSSTSLSTSPAVPHRGIAKTKSNSSTSPSSARKLSSGLNVVVCCDEVPPPDPSKKSQPASSPASPGVLRRSFKGSTAPGSAPKAKSSGSPLNKPSTSRKDLTSSPSSLLRESSKTTKKT